MKKKTIWTIAVIMGVSFLILLFLQLKYIQEMVDMKKEQFDESVNRSLYQASRNLELNETLRYLEKDVNETERKAFKKDSVGTRSGHPDATVQQSHQYAAVGKDGTIYTSFELKTISSNPATKPKGMILENDKGSISEASRSLQEIVKNRYVYQKALLDEVVVSILYSASDKPLKERINFKLLDQDLKAELMNNGVNIGYHFTVSTQDGREVYRCPDYSDEGEEYTYTQILFRNDPVSKMGVVKLHFPDMNSYIYSSIRFMIPSVIFTVVLLITFILTILFDLTIAIEVGLIIACLLFMKRMAETSDVKVIMDEIDLTDETDVRLENNEHLTIPTGVEVYEINGPYFFGAGNKFEEIMANFGDRPKVRIIRMRKVPFVDSTGIHNLTNLCMMSRKEGIQIVLSGVTPKVEQVLEHAGFYQIVGKENICSHINLALERAKEIIR